MRPAEPPASPSPTWRLGLDPAAAEGEAEEEDRAEEQRGTADERERPAGDLFLDEAKVDDGLRRLWRGRGSRVGEAGRGLGLERAQIPVFRYVGWRWLRGGFGPGAGHGRGPGGHLRLGGGRYRSLGGRRRFDRGLQLGGVSLAQEQ